MANLSIIGNVSREFFAGDALTGFTPTLANILMLIGAITALFVVFVFIDMFMFLWDEVVKKKMKW